MKNMGVSQIRGGSFMMPPRPQNDNSDEVFALRKKVEELEAELKICKLSSNPGPSRETIEEHRRRVEAMRQYAQAHNLKSVSE